MNLHNKKIFLLITDAGGGHRAFATALQFLLNEQGFTDVSIINVYKEILNSDQEKIYNNIILANGLTKLWWLFFVPAFMVKIKIFKGGISKKITDYFRKNRPDIIISLLPFLNEIIYNSTSILNINTLTVVTDFDEPCDNYWITKNTSQVLVPNSMAEKKALAILDCSKIINLNGYLVHKKYYQQQITGKNETPKKVMILYGGFMDNNVVDKIKILTEKNLEPYIICGHNKNLYESLKKQQLEKVHVFEYVTNLNELMSQVDFMIGKPGPGCIAECIQMELPMLLELNNKTMLQEQSVATYVVENKIGLSFDNLVSFERNLDNFLLFSEFKNFKINIKKLKSNPSNLIINTINLWC